MCYVMYDHEWHVWVLKLVFHLNLCYSSVSGCFAFLRPCFLYGLAFLAYYIYVLSSDKHFILMSPYHIITFPCSRFECLWFIDSFLVGRPIDFSFSCWILFLTFAVSIKFQTNNENLPKQCTYSIHVNRIKCMLHPKKASI